MMKNLFLMIVDELKAANPFFEKNIMLLWASLLSISA
jgi:hypothetical protein